MNRRSLWRACGIAVLLCATLIGAKSCAATGQSFSGIHFHRTRHDQRMAHVALEFVIHQIGKPYLWGGNGPDSYDCSGLMNAAWAQLGINLSPDVPRATSETQWADGTKVSNPQPGDLIFFAGADGTTSSPGHVGMILDPKKQTMIEAYAPGTTIRVAYYDNSNAPQGDTGAIGVTDPTAGT